MTQRGPLLFALLCFGCGPSTNPPSGGEGEEDTTRGDADDGPGSQTGDNVTTGSMSTGMTTLTTAGPGTGDDDDDDDDVADTEGTGGSSDGGVGFIQPTGGTCLDNLPPGTIAHCTECSGWAQDCPRGEKCVPWANDGGDDYNAMICVPVDPDAVDLGETCSVMGMPYSGVDNCGFGAVCWGVDPDTQEGTCVPQCEGNEIDPECPEGSTCIIEGWGAVTVCLPECDPLDATTCADGMLCVPAYPGFACTPPGPDERGYCDFDSCAPGSVCVDTDVGGCEGPTCCTEWCDLAEPLCPDPKDACWPFFAPGTEPRGFENLGFCT